MNSNGGMVFIKSEPLGPFGNNSYLIADEATREAVLIDAPQGIEAFIPHIAGFDVRRVLITHRHIDHWGGLQALLGAIHAPVFCHEADSELYSDRLAGTLADVEAVRVGNMTIEVIHTPGHTPGSICLLAGDHLIAGDTLFSGGPGRTSRPEHLAEEIDSIRRRLFTLPESTIVHPGHGADTTIGVARAEYEVFASRDHAADLCGDVTWTSS